MSIPTNHPTNFDSKCLSPSGTCSPFLEHSYVRRESPQLHNRSLTPSLLSPHNVNTFPFSSPLSSNKSVPPHSADLTCSLSQLATYPPVLLGSIHPKFHPNSWPILENPLLIITMLTWHSSLFGQSQSLLQSPHCSVHHNV